jgi:pyroglutamyl-peptidase
MGPFIERGRQMTQDKVLVTGFAPYGGRGRNPSAEIAAALDGRTVGGMAVVGRQLPVSLEGIGSALSALIEEIEPCVVISLGLWPGAPFIRIERVALNLADFEIADNAGRLASDEPILGNGATALYATLPIRKIERRLIGAGIPARISNTAGTFLCNACLYTLLTAAAARRGPAMAGFIHIPYLPEQVALMLQEMKTEARMELHQRGDLASMELTLSTRAIELALEASIAELGR